MTDYADAKAELEASIAANKAFLAARDAPANLAATFGALVQIRDSMNEWIRAEIALRTLNAENDAAISQGLTQARIQDLRQDAGRLQSLGTEIRDLVVLIAGKAEQP